LFGSVSELSRVVPPFNSGSELSRSASDVGLHSPLVIG
jgi:hypothetical protein